MKTAPPRRYLVTKLRRSCRDSGGRSFWNRPKNPFQLRRRPFFFWDYLILCGKTVSISDFGRKFRLNFGEDLLFWGGSPVFGRKNRFNFRFWAKNPSQFRRKPFFFFFFGDHLFLGGKTVSNSDFGRIRLNLLWKQWKFGSRSLTVVSLFQKSPPPFFQILATCLGSLLDDQKFFRSNLLAKATLSIKM